MFCKYYFKFWICGKIKLKDKGVNERKIMSSGVSECNFVFVKSTQRMVQSFFFEITIKREK